MDVSCLSAASPSRSVSSSAVARARYLADVSSSQVFSAKPSTPPRKSRATARQCDASSVSDAVSNDRSIEERSQTLPQASFEPRWDLQAMAPRWNRIVNVNSSRAMGTSVLPHKNCAQVDLQVCAAAAATVPDSNLSSISFTPPRRVVPSHGPSQAATLFDLEGSMRSPRASSGAAGPRGKLHEAQRTSPRRPSLSARRCASVPSGRSAATSSTRSGVCDRAASPSCPASSSESPADDKAPISFHGSLHTSRSSPLDGKARSLPRGNICTSRLSAAAEKPETQRLNWPSTLRTCSEASSSSQASLHCSWKAPAAGRPTARHASGQPLSRSSSEAGLQGHKGTRRFSPREAGPQAVEEARWLSPREALQKFNRSSILEQRGVYDHAESSQCWKVSELLLEKLPSTTDENKLSRICSAFGHQVVRVQTAWNPIKDSIADGKAKVLLRGQPGKSTSDLTSFLETNLRCKASAQAKLGSDG